MEKVAGNRQGGCFSVVMAEVACGLQGEVPFQWQREVAFCRKEEVACSEQECEGEQWSNLCYLYFTIINHSNTQENLEYKQ